MAMKENLGIKRQVLIVEDERINMLILGKILGDEYEKLHAEDGEQAMKLIRENADTLSLVLLDLILPRMDGYKILDIMQSDNALKQIPVIVCTSEINSEARCLQMGAVDFIAKPYIHPEVIRARVKRTIELSEGIDLIRATENDSLTGLYNYEYFLKYSALRDQYYSDEDMDAIVININKLHSINEFHGREMGNRVILCTARCIRGIAEFYHGIAGRGSGDEFLMYIPHERRPRAILKIIEDNITEIVADTKITIRMGVYPKVDKTIKAEDRFDRARHACNSVRGNFNVRLAIYDKEMNEKEIYQDSLVNSMEKAMESGRFVVFYQPKYAIQGDRNVLYSAEALIRWDHPDYGLLSPAAFIPLFEKQGLIHKLDHYVWNEVARQVGEWMIRYDFKLPVSVNVSRVDMVAPDLDDEIYSLVEKNWITPDLLHLEITESAYTSNADQMVETVQELRDRGFEIEIDDFGTGYSALNMISSMPIDVIKLDMSFIKRIHLSDKEMHLVKLMLDMASFVNARVVAEGVENREQYELLKNAGCDMIQGYYFSRPCQACEFEKLIEKEISCRHAAIV
ncbi:MAG: EAL domain-containing protein [Butyrivibrio sp.]|jgi:EAL domain-containing protein (putative c-di-GMP-specific phosphodiesterase class I)/CheY-like chemotaxis protein|nr:EAL domain-containing protein [Butyrivibrio sp.]